MTDLPALPFGTALTGQAAAEWAVAILDALKAPITEANVYSFAGWFAREGGGGSNNPMNTTLGSQYPTINSDGVRDFPTPGIGVQETVATLEDGYSAIVASFRAGVGLEKPNAATAAELHEWSGGGYTFIQPVVVPMPAPADPHHYLWFDPTVVDLPHGRNSERAVVENYDKQRLDLQKNSLSLLAIEENLEALANRVTTNRKGKTAAYITAHHMDFRFVQLAERAKGVEVVKP